MAPMYVCMFANLISYAISVQIFREIFVEHHDFNFVVAEFCNSN